MRIHWKLRRTSQKARASGAPVRFHWTGFSLSMNRMRSPLERVERERLAGFLTLGILSNGWSDGDWPNRTKVGAACSASAGATPEQATYKLNGNACV
ncbi:hypothetical protein ACFX2A_017511 [Malus domestica]